MYGGNEIKGLFLLILAIGGGYTAETLGCKTQKLLSNNMYVKHMYVSITCRNICI